METHIRPDEWKVREWSRATAKLEARVEELEAQHRWIPVSERLPEKSGYYWVYGHDPRSRSVERDKKLLFRFEYQEWEGMSDWIITHWMPLPTPPKEDA